MAYSKKSDVNCVFVHGPIIIGAGPSGLAAAVCLQQNDVPSLILERRFALALRYLRSPQAPTTPPVL